MDDVMVDILSGLYHKNKIKKTIPYKQLKRGKKQQPTSSNLGCNKIFHINELFKKNKQSKNRFSFLFLQFTLPIDVFIFLLLGSISSVYKFYCLSGTFSSFLHEGKREVAEFTGFPGITDFRTQREV